MTELEEKLHYYVDHAHFMKDYQLKLISAEPDHVLLSAPIRQEICNNFGVAHGGFYMSIADTTAGLAAFTDGRRYVTQNASFQFLSNIRKGFVFAEGTVLHRGRTVASVWVEIKDEAGKLLCEGLFSMFVVQKAFSPILSD